jgi:hypothetical protein
VGFGLSLDHLDGPVAHAVSVGYTGDPGLAAERAPGLSPLGGPVEAPALSAGPPRRYLAPGTRGLKRGLRAGPRTVLLLLDETLMTEMPPLAYGYGRRGEQVAVPVPGTHARRVLHGALNIRSGDVLLCITETWDQATHHAFLRMIRAHWRGWQIVLFEDRGAPHTAAAIRRLAKE